MATTDSFGHFLSFPFWEDAIILLEAQIQAKKTNKHFKNLSTHCYEEIGDVRKKIGELTYFESVVANNMFYALEEEFRLHQYTLPKRDLMLRTFTLFRYPIRILYYAVGLYLMKLSQEFLDDQFSPRRDQFQTYYGAGIHFNNDRLVVSKDKLYFKQYYQSYRSAINKEVDKDAELKVVLRFDVAKYFDELPTDRLLDELESCVKSSVKAKLKYDTRTIEQLRFFFLFLMGGKRGIPMTNTDIISLFIGHIYLSLVDIAIDDILARYTISSTLSGHMLIRYMDDYCVTLSFGAQSTRRERSDITTQIALLISDLFHEQFDLRLNEKTQVYFLDDEDDRNRLRSNLKRVSNGMPIQPEDEESDEGTVLQYRLDVLFKELERLNKFDEKCIFERIVDVEEEALRQIYDARVDQLLHKPENMARLNTQLSNLNLHIVKMAPMELTIIIMKDPSAKSALKSFLMDITELSTTDCNLILIYLAQCDFSDNDLLAKLRQDKRYKGIVSDLDKPSCILETPGYFGLSRQQIVKLEGMLDVVEQARFRIYSEKIGAYSVALNHLLNEIHALCYNLDSALKNDYNSKSVASYLISRKVPSTLVTRVRNLFDRRNMNQISHPGSDQYVTWGVTRGEYEQFHLAVGECFAYLL